MIAASSCADGGGPSGDGDGHATVIAGATWILGAASVEALIDEVAPEDARVTIRFERDGSAGGSAGCNSFGGSYTAGDDGSISIEASGMTQMACEEPLMRLESAYVAALGDVASWRVLDEGEGLELSGGETPLTYAAEQPIPLEGTRWRIDGISIGGDAVSSTIAGADADLTFEAGTVSGSTGCNRLTGAYATEGDASEGSISFSDVATTKKLCDPDAMEQEQQILAALDDAASYSIQGSAMSLLDADGAFLLSLVG